MYSQMGCSEKDTLYTDETGWVEHISRKYSKKNRKHKYEIFYLEKNVRCGLVIDSILPKYL
jgi:hypothetical protein